MSLNDILDLIHSRQFLQNARLVKLQWLIRFLLAFLDSKTSINFPNFMKKIKKGSTPKPIECPALPLQSIHHIHSSNSLPPGVLGICNRITNHILQKYLQNSTCLFVNQAGNALYAAPPSKPTDGGFRDSLDVVTEDFPVALCSALP
ncbi:hypothetical protein ACJIZ3_017959 [Penstemon smallii]|uniref:Uncharacterized protein n=1 Tax=Penstemon smallii TaxID=265156 RepID=A0ABD3SX10_9LAMI